LVKQWSTWAITSKTSLTTPNDPPWSTLVNLWSNPSQRPLEHLWPSYVARNFCRVLQISPKHFKISQCKSCVFCRGTQLSCWVALLVRSARWWKLQVTLPCTIHWRPENSQVAMDFVHKWWRKTPYTLCRSCRGMLDLQLSYSNLGAIEFNFLEKTLLTQNVHLAPNTQQAEQAGFTRAKSHETCQSIFPEN
jgi:hypothetical protein